MDPSPKAADVQEVPTVGAATERRIAWLTIVFGLLAAAILMACRKLDWSEGVAFGTVLAWLNFRWLRRGMDILVIGSEAQEGGSRPRVPLVSYFTAAFRYALLALGVYVIFIYLHVPLVSLILGLCALGAAAVAASVWEILQRTD
jgi:hypothetical protein